MISLKNTNKYFFKGRPNEIHVINDISMELPDNGIVALFGKSGCGKTTLLNCIGGLDSLKSGEIEIDGKNIRKDTDSIRNQYIGYIFQNYNLNLKVNNYENVAEALRLCGMEDEAEIEKRVSAALANVGMSKYIHRMPDTLSGGQKQRIAIARAIVKNPKIILADEPTGNLDEANTIMIMDLLKSISKDHLVVLVTHEANLVDYYCDRVIELKDGCVEGIRDNSDANGYVARDKNTVYLGELEKNEQELGQVKFETYGQEFPEGLVISLVNHNGSILLKCNSSKIKYVDESSEIKFKEEKFEEKTRRIEQESMVDMSKLPPVQGKNYGRLFRFGNAAKESYHQLRAKKSKGNQALKKGIIFFTLIITVMLATFGKQIKAIIDAASSYSQYTFYGYAESNDQIKQLYAALESGDKGIDCIRNVGYPISEDENYELDTAIFETFNYETVYAMYGEPAPVTGHAVMLSESLIKDTAALYGNNKELKDGEVVISLGLAKIFAENSKVGFITKPEEVIGFKIKYLDCKVVGIVDVDEAAVYVCDSDFYAAPQIKNIYEAVADTEVTDGHVVYHRVSHDDKRPGDTVNLYGKDFVISEIREASEESMLAEILNSGCGVYVPEGTELTAEVNEDEGTVTISGDFYGKVESFVLGEEEYNSFLAEVEVKKTSYYEMTKSDYVQLKKDNASNAEKTFVQVHANDIGKCEAFMRELFAGKKAPAGIPFTLKTPDNIYKELTEDLWLEFVSQLTSIMVFIMLLCVCIYLIMRGSIMSRVREIGIYRCIGVTRKNMTFRFMVESFMLTNLTVLPAFVALIGLMHVITHSSGLDLAIFMPWWLCVPMLGIMYIITIICGIIPVLSLLTKTPSQIMAKYDV